MTTIIDIKPWRNGRKVFECAGVEPVFLVKDQALDVFQPPLTCDFCPLTSDTWVACLAVASE